MPKLKFNETKVKALLVGINYIGTSHALGGCINDVLNTQRRILSEYPTAQITLLTDRTPEKPTRDNIINKLIELVNNSESGDTLMFHYSGHGSQVRDIHGDEEDGMDETICPLDFTKPRTVVYNGRTYNMDSQILDDEIHEIISKVPKHVKFLMLSDSCHSGTVADLKNDFAHYHGPSKIHESSSDNGSDAESDAVPATATAAAAATAAPSSNQNATTITCNAHWTYAPHAKELWITPLNWDFYQICSHLKVKLVNQPPTALTDNPSLSCETTFKKLPDGNFKLSAFDISKESFIATAFSVRSDRSIDIKGTFNLHFNPFLKLSETFNINAALQYRYNNKDKTHTHSCGGTTRSLNMKSPSSAGGELRVISGCEENQTSADTGTNGACTRAFWDTVTSMGGLRQFFPKLFSHYVEDLKNIQDQINLNLSKFGFTQHSIISWEQAQNASRALLTQATMAAASQGSAAEQFATTEAELADVDATAESRPLKRPRLA